ncbi:TPA: hypothetical protein N0F65_010007 [Lagenidium giganteum]|uniref:Uncharacterized protein n=1 Tax=Lagenidium giganteum TaxID=4803 RepID=A0AAV2ZDR6_9STRA|nr:TPA: hypothetical protein N0F65_010007 [Lagenidium giganteum]
MRRAQQALEALDVDARATDDDGTDAQEVATAVFEPDYESRFKVIRERPLSYIRPKRSFFCDDDADNVTDGRRKKSKRAPQDLEPRPNADTLYLRQHAHEAFIARPSKQFSTRERKIVQQFAQENMGADRTQDLPLSTWNEISRMRPPIHRSGFECKLHWDLREKPSLRSGAWTKEEDRVLKELATGSVDPSLVNHWEEIARRMPIPGRPAVHCLIRFQTKLNANALVCAPFTAEEDATIRQAVEVFGDGRWNIIADLLDGRIPEQVRHRWQLSLSPTVRLGKLSVIEDRRLLLAIRAYHDHEQYPAFLREQIVWNDICNHVPGRTQPQLRDRFTDSLSLELSFKSWTPDEDAKLLQLVQEYGVETLGVWARVGAELGTRTDKQVARRWRTLAPTEYKRYKKAKDSAREGPIAIFTRPSRGRRDPNVKKRSSTRSSYNGEEAKESAEDGTAATTAADEYKMDESMAHIKDKKIQPIVTSTKPTRCYRPKEWTPEVEEAFRVQQTGWRDLKEYMETYGQPERWENGFIRCTRVKSNGYYTYWRAFRECDDKYIHSVKVFEYA